ncbi:MAG TPA: ABC transporter ATP-binding protein [Steroidobacteraceae bacterium]|nr:ABC transporter ATP-binding protein [Steroidobacteraceae bacterium]
MLKLVKASRKFVGGDVMTTALNEVHLEIEAGEYVAVMGPSGCGKSTLLGILGMLDAPDSGEYWFDGSNVASCDEAQLNELRRGRVGFIFQGFNLLEELTVAQNVALALEYSDLPPAERRERVAQILEKLGIAHRAGHHPSQLSGGQQQRVAIARALVTRPLVLLADEPTGNLDSAHGEEVMQLLQQINAEGTTIVMVTHSAAHAARAARTVGMLDGAIR